MQNDYIQIVPTDISLVGQVLDYYKRNREFLQEFEPIHINGVWEDHIHMVRINYNMHY